MAPGVADLLAVLFLPLVVVRWLLAPVLGIFRSKHSLPVQGAGRSPPDPDLFPNYVQNAKGLWLHWRSWAPADARAARGVVVALHGLGEHAGRYEGHAGWLVRKGFVVFLMEHQGHGSSEGDRKYVERFSDYIDDQELFLRSVVIARHPELAHLPRFLLAHSMGGLIGALLAHRISDLLKAVVLSAPALQADPTSASPLMRSVARTLGSIAPKLGLKGLDPALVSSVASVVAFYRQDPLVPQTPMQARWGSEMLEAMDQVMQRAPSFTLPILIVHGESDRICAIAGSEEFFAKIRSADKDLVRFPGLFHEVLNETPEARLKVRNTIIEFLNRQLAQLKNA